MIKKSKRNRAILNLVNFFNEVLALILVFSLALMSVTCVKMYDMSSHISKCHELSSITDTKINGDDEFNKFKISLYTGTHSYSVSLVEHVILFPSHISRNVTSNYNIRVTKPISNQPFNQPIT